MLHVSGCQNGRRAGVSMPFSRSKTVRMPAHGGSETSLSADEIKGGSSDAYQRHRGRLGARLNFDLLREGSKRAVTTRSVTAELTAILKSKNAIEGIIFFRRNAHEREFAGRQQGPEGPFRSS